jgi:hypothetical protein
MRRAYGVHRRHLIGDNAAKVPTAAPRVATPLPLPSDSGAKGGHNRTRGTARVNPLAAFKAGQTARDDGTRRARPVRRWRTVAWQAHLFGNLQIEPLTVFFRHFRVSITAHILG